MNETQRPRQHRFSHDAILIGLSKRKALVNIMLISGENPIGRISQIDKWTVTLRDQHTDQPRTYYKHAIESFGEHITQ